jgi:tripartite-type tricarboxylate transporter receptor subunit TctC
MRLLVVLALLLLSENSARSEDVYPSRPVTMIVPSAPGGQLDVLARILATAMHPALGQPVIIENVSGPSGVVKSVRAAPDGYTLAFGNNGSLVFTAIMLPSLKLDPLQDYSPISLVGSMPMILVVNKSSGPNTLADLLDVMRKNEDKVMFGAAAPGSTSHTASTLLIERTKLKANVVPYRGTGVALQDLIAGTIHVVVDASSTVMPLQQGGSVKALAVSGDRRLSNMPDVPTFAEAGLPSFDMVVWTGVVGPAGMSAKVVEKISTAISAALNDPFVQQRFGDISVEPAPGRMTGPAAMAKFLAKEDEVWRPIFTAAGLIQK